MSSVRECTLDVPFSVLRSVAPNAFRIRLIGLNDQTGSIVPAAGSYITVTL